jgi:hypothetical protein
VGRYRSGRRSPRVIRRGVVPAVLRIPFDDQMQRRLRRGHPIGRTALPLAGLAVAVAVTTIVVLVQTGGPSAGGGTPAARPGVAPPMARELADSVGVNVHLTYDDTPYADFERVRSALRELGVRHVRDGLVPQRPDQYARLHRLAQAGIRSTLIMGAPRLTRVADQVHTLRTQLSRAVEAVEGPNEYDISGDAEWADALRGYQRELYAAINDDPGLRSLPVYGPTVVLPENRGVLDELRRSFDVANLHPYPAGGPPEAVLGSEVSKASPLDKPLVATETGYHNAVAATEGQPPVEEAVAADYLPRLLLTAFADGIERTFWYELLDTYPDAARTTADANWGLLRNDFTPKPAFAALANLMRLTGDDSGGDAARRPLDVSVTASSRDVGRLLLQKGDGVYLIALWRDVPLENEGARRALEERPLQTEVSLPRRAVEVAVHRPSRSAEPVRRLTAVDRVSVPLAGDAVVLELTFEPS